MGQLLDEAKLKPGARFILFHCYHRLDGDFHYESCDLIDARHPQTILAYGLNGNALPVANGAPLRLRLERALGYKHAKYIHRIEAVDSLSQAGLGRGGYWEDRGYDWYAGI